MVGFIKRYQFLELQRDLFYLTERKDTERTSRVGSDKIRISIISSLILQLIFADNPS
jgi:hypothetical protein